MSTTKELSNAIAKQMQTRVENVGEDDNPVEFIIAVDAVDGGLYSTIPEFRRMQGETDLFEQLITALGFDIKDGRVISVILEGLYHRSEDGQIDAGECVARLSFHVRMARDSETSFTLPKIVDAMAGAGVDSLGGQTTVTDEYAQISPARRDELRFYGVSFVP